MGLFSFLANAGKKIFGGNKDAEAGQPVQQLNTTQLDAIKAHISSLGINIANLDVKLNAPGDITITGEAATKADAEKVSLMAGNVMGITNVNNQLTIAAPEAAAEPDSDTYEIQKGDTLWAIATKYYGNGAAYPKIVEANQPMIKDADEIYPGQVLRIPKEAPKA
ncbi:MAG: peptidoglycan-binding protein LysM [Bacteroidetes bacterium]|nr:peptidoglycan-binding protein LysM [Bacteroidota bacterium]